MTTKRFIKLQCVFIILLAITFAFNTFAWANRPAIQGGGYMTSDSQYTAIQLTTPSYNINGTSCTAVTYQGTKDPATGIITYDETTPIDFSDGALRINAPGNSEYYFKTIIKNHDAETPTNVSMFINASYDQRFGSKFYINVTSPVVRNVVIPAKDAIEGKTPIEFLPIVRAYEIGADTTSNIEWNMYNANTNISGVIELKDVILSNN